MSRRMKRLFVAINLLLAFILLFSIIKVFDIQIPRKSTQAINLEAKRIVDQCFRGSVNREKCYKEMFVKLVKNRDFVFAQKTLYAAQDLDPFLRSCHVQSHDIAEAAARKEPARWKELMEQADVNTCGGGFLHGILVAHVGDDPDFKITSDFINETCRKKEKGEIEFSERTCAHILGHLILLDTDRKIDPALPICEKTDSAFSLECYNGIFMEESFKLILVDHGLAELPVRDEKRMITQEKRCFKYSGLAGVACWVDMAEIFAEFYHYDAAKTYESCNRAPEERARSQCYLKAVILMAVSPNHTTKETLLSECAPYNGIDQLYTHCTHFIISSLMHFSPKFADRGIKLCSNIEEHFRESCFKDLGEQLTMNISSRSERKHYCTGTPEKYQDLCLN